MVVLPRSPSLRQVMKEVFFTFLAISLPIVAVGGLAYMFLHGLYRVIDDWRLSRELRQLRQETAGRQPHPLERPVSELDLVAAFDDRPRPPEPRGIATFPLDPDWDVAPTSSRAADAVDDAFQPADSQVAKTATATSPIVRPELAEHREPEPTHEDRLAAAVDTPPPQPSRRDWAPIDAPAPHSQDAPVPPLDDTQRPPPSPPETATNDAPVPYTELARVPSVDDTQRSLAEEVSVTPEQLTPMPPDEETQVPSAKVIPPPSGAEVALTVERDTQAAPVEETQTAPASAADPAPTAQDAQLTPATEAPAPHAANTDGASAEEQPHPETAEDTQLPPAAEAQALPSPLDVAPPPEHESRIDADVEEVPQPEAARQESHDRDVDDWPRRTLD
jgi:hypothetical protein